MKPNRFIQILNWLAVIIFVLVLFQALITTWPGANFGHLDLFRIWKELLLVPLSLSCLYLVYKDKKLRQWFTNSPLILMIAGFAILQIGIGFYALVTNKVNSSALIYALLINLRFLVFLVVCLVLAVKSDWLASHWRKFILWPAAIVIAFGLLQQFVLPNNFLTHFGYGPKTIAAYQTVDKKPQYVRLQSTLRGPNPLGAYLTVILTIVAAFWLKRRGQIMWAIIAVAGSVVLYYTYSRSAWLGAFLACGLISYWTVKNKQSKRRLVVGCGLIIVLLVGAIILFQRNTILENTLFHTSQTSQSPESSNAVRSEAMLDGAKSVIHSPLGQGPGTAGPASTRNNYPARIAENYFIQVGQEVGLIGLGLFIAINIYVALKLWSARHEELAAIALAALVGLTLVNLLSHAWADDTLAYIYWGLAGIALAPSVILNKERKHAKTKEETA